MAKRAKQFRLGEFWLAWRTDRQEWAICWNDQAARTRRRKSTGVSDYNDGSAPAEAQQALAEHFRVHGQPEAIDPNQRQSVSLVLATWLSKEGAYKARAQQYAYAVGHLQRWIDGQGGMNVAAITPERVKGYIDMRIGEGVTGETVQGELAALSRSLKWGVLNQIIPYAPLIPRVEAKHKSGPKEVEYSKEQVAALLEAAASRVDRIHVQLFAMIMLSTHARVEAVLELDASQIRDGLIYFNAPSRAQTIKKRAIVPVTPTLAKLLPTSGKVIQQWNARKDGSITGRDVFSIRKSFANCLIDAGITKNGKPWGSPNSLRHTIHTQLQRVGVPQAQIDTAAGHATDGGRTGRNYTHLRPEYLKEFCEAIEAYWADLDRLTQVHRRSLIGPNLYDHVTGKAL